MLNKLTVVMQCYVDESSDGFGNHTVVMAGYVADEVVWSQFNEAWNEELKKQGLKYAHFKIKNVFEREKSKASAEAFYRIIEKHLDKSFCIVCSVPKYRKLIQAIKFPESLKRSTFLKRIKNDPLFIMYRAFMEFCFDCRSKLGISEPVNLIFDKTAKYESAIEGMFEYLYFSAEHVGVPPEKLGKKPSFADDEDTPALQAADLLAGVIRYNIVNKQDATNMPWSKTVDINNLITHIDEKYLLYVFDSSFSESSYKTYRKYYSKKNYWFYDAVYPFIARLPYFIRKPILRLLKGGLSTKGLWGFQELLKSQSNRVESAKTRRGPLWFCAHWDAFKEEK